MVGNYNVTTQSINSSKMTAFKSFLHGKMYQGEPLLAQMIGTKCQKYMKNIGITLVDSFDVVRDNVSQIRSATNQVNGHASIDRIVENLDKMFESMQIVKTIG